jgi:hypothetical protein
MATASQFSASHGDLERLRSGFPLIAEDYIGVQSEEAGSHNHSHIFYKCTNRSASSFGRVFYDLWPFL